MTTDDDWGVEYFTEYLTRRAHHSPDIPKHKWTNWTYCNRTLWSLVYAFLGRHLELHPDHKLVDVRFSVGMDYNVSDIMPAGVYYPTIKLVFTKPCNITYERWLW